MKIPPISKVPLQTFTSRLTQLGSKNVYNLLNVGSKKWHKNTDSMYLFALSSLSLMFFNVETIFSVSNERAFNLKSLTGITEY